MTIKGQRFDNAAVPAVTALTPVAAACSPDTTCAAISTILTDDVINLIGIKSAQLRVKGRILQAKTMHFTTTTSLPTNTPVACPVPGTTVTAQSRHPCTNILDLVAGNF